MHPLKKPTAMQPSFKLQVQTPCHENWQAMTETEKGRFCKSCAKEVVDFTQMTDEELLRFFTNKKEGNTCGRLYQDQLERPLVSLAPARNRPKWSWNIAAMLFVLLFKTHPSKAQAPAAAITQQVAGNNDPLAPIGQPATGTQQTFTLTGSVKDNNGEPVAGVSVSIIGKKMGTLTDTNGAYQLGGVKKGDVIVLSAVGYQPERFTASTPEQQSVIMQYSLMGDVVVTVGGISLEDGYEPAPVPEYVACFEVRDKKDGHPLDAGILVKRHAFLKDEHHQTGKKGIYKLRHIREWDRLTVVISAPGYKDSTIEVRGRDFSLRKLWKTIFLEKIPVSTTACRVIVGGVRSIQSDPLYIIDGVLADKDQLAALDPAILEDIQVLKGIDGAALFGGAASNGIILITTKKTAATPTTKTGSVEAQDKRIMPTPIPQLASISIAPNPVRTGGSCLVQFQTNRADILTLQVFSEAGTVLQQSTFTTNAGKNTVALPVNTAWAAGRYLVRLLDKKTNESLTAAMIIQ